MKKIFITLAAVAAIAACSKSEVEYQQTGEISLAPVPQNMTKTMITGEAFPTAESFNVWAWYKQLPAGTSVADWQDDATADQWYINEKEFENRSGGADWGGATPYYWPKLGSLLFAGYYPTAIADDVEYVFSATENKMVFSDIQQSEVAATGSTEDIMYFNMTPNSVASGPVAVVFKHALSWITVNVQKTAGSPKIVIDEIKFTEVYPKGTGTVSGTDDIIWATSGTAAATVVAEDVELSETSAPLDKEPLLIPQDMNGKLVIKYTVYSSDTEYFTEVYEDALNTLKEGVQKWEPAKHYIYNIAIGTTEVLIQPEVAEWDPVEIPVTVE